MDVPKPWHAPLESKNMQHSQSNTTTNSYNTTVIERIVRKPVAYHFSVFLFTGPGPGETFRVPRMYNTEYQFYGSEKPVTV